MADLNQNRISVYPGINDQPRPALPHLGANGAWLTKAINDLIDEVNLLKQRTSGGKTYIEFSSYHDISEENSTIQIIASCPFDIFLSDLYISDSENFSSINLKIGSYEVNLNPGESPEIFVMDEELAEYDEEIRLSLVVSPGNLPISEPFPINIILGAFAESSFIGEATNLP